MTSFEDVDTDKNGSIEKSEWDKLLLDDKRMQIEDENSKRDQQRKMVWFSLLGMLLYPFAVVAESFVGLDEAQKTLGDMAPTYFVAVAGIVAAFFGAQAWSKGK